MSKMGRYCKAYPIDRLRAFDGWPPNTQPAENDYLFVQEDLTVTKGIFLEEDVVFDQITPEWGDFCKNTLGFEIPPDVADAGEKAAGAA